MFSFVSNNRRGRAGAAVAAATVLALTGCGSGAETGTQETQETGSQGQGNLREGRLVPAPAAEGHALREVPAEEAPSVQLKVTEDPWGMGWAVHVVTEDFEFAPETLGELRPQEGHAHLYLDGEKISRLYGPWYDLPASAVPAGEHELTVTLNTNDDHAQWAVDGEPITDSVTVKGLDGSESGHNHGGGHEHEGGHEGRPAGPTEKASGSGQDPAAPAPADAPALVASGGQVEGPRQVTVTAGEEVVFTVTSDTADEVHVHGYDMTVPLSPGEPATVRLRAHIPGVFEVELEDSGLLLTQLRVTQ